MVMYEVEMVYEHASYKIFVDPRFGLYVKINKNGSKTVWKKGKPASANIDGKEVNLVEIPDEVLNELSKHNDGYKVTEIYFEYSYEDVSDHHKDCISDAPLTVSVHLRCYSGGVPSHGRGSYRRVRGYNMSEWYKNLDDKYRKLKEKNKQLEQALLHEKYKPGGSGYNEAKRDFEQLGRIDVKVSNKRRK